MKYKYLFVVILLLSIFLRFWKLGSFPPGFTWDEAAIGYNAWGILTVHRDEWLLRTPLSFRSFGDYKSPLAIYITAGSEKVFGPTIFAVRFPVAFASVVLVVASYFLAREIRRHDEKEEEIALFVMLLTAVSPWALHFSTIAFESMIATCLAAWGAYFFCRGIRNSRFFLFSGIAYALSLYAYHSAKLVVPLSILILLYVFRDALRPMKKGFILFFITCFIVASPLLYVSVFGKASERFFGSTAILDSNKNLKPLPEVGALLLSHFGAHLSPSYLFLGAEQTYRQSNMKDGILSPAEGVCIGLALIFAVRRKENRKLVGILLSLIAVSILPATLGFDIPHANRALLGLPWFQLLAGIGILSVWEMMDEKKHRAKFKAPLFFLLMLTMTAGLVWHVRNDAQVYATSRALYDLQYGYEQTVQYARSQESSVNKVYFSDYYGQSYIYLLFFKHMNPIDYRGGGLANYVISNHPYTDAIGQKNILIIGTPSDIPDEVVSEKEFVAPDGRVLFRAVRQ